MSEVNRWKAGKRSGWEPFSGVSVVSILLLAFVVQARASESPDSSSTTPEASEQQHALSTLSFTSRNATCNLIDFEGIPNRTPVGTIVGIPNVTFGPSWRGLIDRDAGGTGNIANEPTPDTVAGTTEPVEPVDFDAGVQFVEVFYCAAAQSIPLTLTAWDGPGGTGNVVETGVGNTVGTSYDGAPCTGDPDGSFCLWDLIQVTSTTNNILSVTFAGGVARYYVLDNMTSCTDLPATGACCLDVDCIETTEMSCLSLNGTYQGDDTVCTDIEACCLPDCSCVMSDPLCCDDIGGVPQGPGTACAPPEAWCFPDNTCLTPDPQCCDDIGGVPQGPGSACGGMEACCDSVTDVCYMADRTCCLANGDTRQGRGTVCTAPEACCFFASCQMLDTLCCLDKGGLPQGAGSTCGGMEACCRPATGACHMAVPACCLANGDTPQGPGSVCTAREACCFADNTCMMLDPLCCADQGGIPQGAGSQCRGPEACCDSVTGACYMADGTCCLANGDMPQGPGAVCTAPEACCFSDGRCQDLDPHCCVGLGGTLRGAGSACEGDADGDGVDDACEPPAAVIPTVPQWGLIVMTVLGLALGTILFGRRRSGRARHRVPPDAPGPSPDAT